MTSNPERLAYWYLRLNGFLLLEDFIIHPDEGRNQRTDIDLLGVRFLHRAENSLRPMQDDSIITDRDKLCNIIITEVKRGQCALNGPWTSPDRRDMHRVLHAIGCFPTSKIEIAAENLYNFGSYQEGDVSCRLVAIGDSHGEIGIPNVPQIFFTNIIGFIFQRFRDYHDEKSSVGNWSDDGRKLKELAIECTDKVKFERQVRHYFGLKTLRETRFKHYR